MYDHIRQKLQALPGVSSVAISSMIPMDGNDSNDVVYAENHADRDGELPKLRRLQFISPGFLSTVGTPLLAGRDFTWSETYQRIPQVIISEDFAREYWNSAQDAVGKRIRVTTNDPWHEIIGVVGDVRGNGVSQPPTSTTYWPLIQNNFETEEVSLRRELAFAVRTPRAGSESFLKEVRQTVWSVDANLPLFSVQTLQYYVQNSMARTSFTLIMLGVAGSMALLLGVVGIYGVIAYSVSQRRREIGIRMALGAQNKIVTNMFVLDGLRLTAIGVVIGLIVAALAVRLMSSLLFNVNSMDPLTYATVSIGLIVTAFLASYLPSRRAAAVDPVEALRAE
jgi:predicted permease